MKSIGEDETTFRQVCHSLIQRHGAYRSINVVRSRLKLLEQTNTEKLEEFPNHMVNQPALGWALGSSGIRWKTSLWRSPLRHHTTTRTESSPLGPTRLTTTESIRFGRGDSLHSALIWMKGVTSIGPHSPFRILRKGDLR